MKIFKDKEQRKATLESLGIHLLITLFFLFFGLSYLDPKPEEGIAIAFGYEADAGGQTVEQPVRQQESVPQPTSSQPEVQDLTTEFTQDNVDAPAITKQEKKPEEKKPQETPVETEKPAEEPVETEKKPTIDDRLRSVTSNPNQANTGGGSGETTGEGMQGREDGRSDRGGSGGGGGVGNSGNYRLGNRQALNKVPPEYTCEGEGRVVVRIRVNQSGKVVSADAGVNIPGGETSNTTSSCLLNRAKVAAERTTWQSDPKAPDLQTGFIIYNFTKK
ncbi:MAG: energy transducer TonB [Cryomorphaceae bacterium]|nr:energy transducer TonB [Cryomorphaceae bacterium]